MDRKIFSTSIVTDETLTISKPCDTQSRCNLNQWKKAWKICTCAKIRLLVKITRVVIVSLVHLQYFAVEEGLRGQSYSDDALMDA